MNQELQTKESGIYLLVNKENELKFVSSSSSIHNAQKNLFKKLNKNEHKNTRLQEHWNKNRKEDDEKYKGDDLFEFEILDVFKQEDIESDPNLVSERKRYWINFYNSNIYQYGYNQELTKREWEIDRDEWYKKNTWGVSEDIRSKIFSYITQLDYSLDYAEDRVNLLTSILDENEINWLTEYISSPLFAKKQVKTKNDFLCENDLSLIGLSVLVDYLTFPKYKNEKEEQVNSVKLRKSKINMDYSSKKEVLFANMAEVELEYVDDDESNSQNLKEAKEQQLYEVQTKHVITEEDLKKYPEIKELYTTIGKLSKILGEGLGTKKKDEIEKEIIKNHGTKELYRLKRFINDLRQEILILKDSLSGTIHFKQIGKTSTKFTYEEDTGYFKENGDYHLISENKIDLGNEKHIFNLIDMYDELKKSTYSKFEDEMYYMLMTLEELIDKAPFEPHIRDILVMKMDGYTNEEIVDAVNGKYEMELTDDRISRIYTNAIPKIIAETYLQDREDWIYTYRVKGNYKKCSKCNENRLAISDKYFGKDSRNKDGLQSICKKCDSYRKIIQKT